MSNTTTPDMSSEELKLQDAIVNVFLPLFDKGITAEYKAHLLSQCRHELKPLLQEHTQAAIDTAVEQDRRAIIATIRQQIDASKENLKYHQTNTKNPTLVKDWEATIQGEVFVLRAVQEQLTPPPVEHKAEEGEL